MLPNWYGHDAANDALCEDSLLRGTRDALRTEAARLGLDLILLTCNFWYEFSLAGGPDRFGFDIPRRALTLFDDGDMRIHTTTWPQCGRAIAALLSLRELPDGPEDGAPALSRFVSAEEGEGGVGGNVYISSFRLSQRDMFDSVKRVTGTTDADWTITRGASAESRWREGRAAVVGGDFSVFTRMLYSRMFVTDGNYAGAYTHALHNDVLGLPVEDLDAATAVAVRMAENGEVPFSH